MSRSLLIALVLAAGFFDLRFRRIPNALTLAALGLGLLLNTVMFETGGAVYTAEGFALAFSLYLPLYLLRGMGAGDVKLMAAIGAIVGPANWLVIFLVTSAIGGVAALALVIARRRFLSTLVNMQTLISSLIRFRAPWRENRNLDLRDSSSLRMPHGAVIACGALLSILTGFLG